MQPMSVSKRLVGVAHAASFGLVTYMDDGDLALSTDPTSEQPAGVIQGGDQYDDDACTVVVSGPAQAVVGAAGITAGFHYVTSDAASKLIAATAGDAVLGFVSLPSAASEDDLVEVNVNPSLGAPAP